MDIEVNSKDHVFYADGVAVSNSHGISYGLNSYLSALCKVKNPTKFYEVYLEHAKNKANTQEELKNLISDARMHGIDVYPPKLGNMYENFTATDRKIYFGINSIKGIGSKECEKIINTFKNDEYFKSLTWMEILCEYSESINKTAFVALISCGCFSGKHTPSRNQMLYEYDVWTKMTDREKIYILQNLEKHGSLADQINILVNNFKLTKTRKDKIISYQSVLENPTSTLIDCPLWIAEKEAFYFGVSLTCAASDMASDDSINTSCKEIHSGLMQGPCKLAATIDIVKEFAIKKEGKNKGKKMAFLEISDNTGSLDTVVLFPEAYEKHKKILYAGNNVVLSGKPTEKGLTVDSIYQL